MIRRKDHPAATLLACLAAILLLLSGCVPVMFLFPLYLDKDIVAEDSIIGSWVERGEADKKEEHWWVITKRESEKGYLIDWEFTDGEEKAEYQYEAVFFKLGGKVYLDVLPVDWDEELDAFGLLSMHIVLKCQIEDSKLVVSFFDDDIVGKQLKAGDIDLSYVRRKGSICIVSPAKKTQKELRPWLEDEENWEELFEFERAELQ